MASPTASAVARAAAPRSRALPIVGLCVLQATFAGAVAISALADPAEGAVGALALFVVAMSCFGLALTSGTLLLNRERLADAPALVAAASGLVASLVSVAAARATLGLLLGGASLALLVGLAGRARFGQPDAP